MIGLDGSIVWWEDFWIGGMPLAKFPFWEQKIMIRDWRLPEATRPNAISTSNGKENPNERARAR